MEPTIVFLLNGSILWSVGFHILPLTVRCQLQLIEIHVCINIMDLEKDNPIIAPFIDFLSDPGKPGVRSMGPDVRH